MKFQSMLSNGTWHDETKPERIERFISQAVEADVWMSRNEGREPRTASEIVTKEAIMVYGVMVAEKYNVTLADFDYRDIVDSYLGSLG